ncbi:MAG: hypothetical protein Q8906_13740, partial [Bacillota bacterium]|nr:hypothetical protein [Bacillota bacterium]
MKSALILGGTQFFGKKLVNILLDNGVDVTIATRGLTPDPFENKVSRLIIERENKESIKAAFEGKQWDVVFDQTCYAPLEALYTKQALEGKVKRYIFTSSQAVYEYGINHSEHDFEPYTYPIVLKGRKEYKGYDGYQEAKRASEAVLFQNSICPTVAVRFTIVVGEDDYSNRLKFHVDHVTNEETMGIANLDNHNAFITSSDAAKFLYEVAKSDFIGPINPGPQGDISMKDLLSLIESIVGKRAIVTDPCNVEPS